ncbi:MAG: hypothetical protein MUO26_08050 [Methanotrichaceae archaeon]|nr:hypothetical protein [Methanotrichaceae archaeon]
MAFLGGLYEPLGEAGMTFAGLYYHLSALKRAGIIELASYREVKGGTTTTRATTSR